MSISNKLITNAEGRKMLIKDIVTVHVFPKDKRKGNTKAEFELPTRGRTRGYWYSLEAMPTSKSTRPCPSASVRPN